jgi:hypothetical protein
MPFSLGYWATAGAGGAAAAGAYEQIATTILGSSATSVTFSVTGLGSTYKHLEVRSVARTSNTSSDWDRIVIRLNGNTTNSNYTWHYLRGSGSAVESAFSNLALTSTITSANAVSNSFGTSITTLLDFADTNKNKTLRSFGGNVGGNNWISLTSNAFLSTSAVTSIALSPQFGTDFLTGSRFSLYGIKG